MFIFGFLQLASQSTIDCNKKIKSLNIEFIKTENRLNKEQTVFNKIKDSLSIGSAIEKLAGKLKVQNDTIKKLKTTLNTLHETYKNYKAVCSDNKFIKGFKIDTLTIDKFTPYDLENLQQTEEVKEPVTYSYFNEDLILSNSIIDENKQNTAAAKVFNQVLKQVNEETYFGDITIPQEDQEFYFYSYEKVKKGTKSPCGQDDNCKYDFVRSNSKSYKFKKIDIEIKDGNFFDIQVQVEYNGQLLWFENHIGLNFLKINKLAKINYLFYLQKDPNNEDESDYNDLRVRLSDVFAYKYKMGNNYIPHDLVLELPKKDVDNQKTNENAPATYQIKQDTYLDKIIELRTYTDFFSLFGNSNNGLVQIEGNAKFYIFPNPHPIKIWATGQQYEFLKSITPYVHYAKFDDDSQNVAATGGTIENKLELIEKRFLSLGANLNVFELYHKNYPMKASIFGTAAYNISKVKNDVATPENLKSLSLGGGVEISSNRLNNFGFNYKLSILWFDYENFNTSGINTNFGVPVFSNQAEIFYHPNKNPNQAIFVRLGTFNYKGKNSNEAFYQFQFGYKFSIGSRTVKK